MTINNRAANNRAAPLRHMSSRMGMLALLACLIWPAATHAGTISTPANCTVLSSARSVSPVRTPSLSTVQEGFSCLLAHYVTGANLDDRVLLRGAYTEMNSALQANGIVVPGAMREPAFTGSRGQDWGLFAHAYASLNSLLPASSVIPGALAEVALAGMTGSLHDDHTDYVPGDQLKPLIGQLFDSGPVPTFGLVLSIISATQPIFVTTLFKGAPAAQAGIKLGDVILLVNGHAPFSDVRGLAGFAPLLAPRIGSPVTLVLSRPATGATLTFHLMPKSLQTPDSISRVIAGHVYYVKLFSFTKDAASRIMAEVAALPASAKITGMVLDLRGNEGGVIGGAIHLLSAFAHHKTLFYSVDGNGKRSPQGTDDSVPLLGWPLVVLTDSASASASEIVAGSVRDYHLGTLIGTRTAGALAGADFFGLNDGGGLEITEARVLGPHGETVDGVGVVPDQQLSTSPQELSTGHDPVIDWAVRDLKRLAQPH
ncbi:MAG TPA: S41 family peptidase [Chloroflexota bacterium]|nr:S41 family peptidase [Chloroflexota bacterium]